MEYTLQSVESCKKTEHTPTLSMFGAQFILIISQNSPVVVYMLSWFARLAGSLEAQTQSAGAALIDIARIIYPT
jgi:hypothetical protein